MENVSSLKTDTENKNSEQESGLKMCPVSPDLQTTDQVSEPLDPNFIEERIKVDRRKLEQMIQVQGWCQKVMVSNSNVDICCVKFISKNCI